MSSGVDDDLEFELKEDFVRIKNWLDQMEKETKIGSGTEECEMTMRWIDGRDSGDFRFAEK